MTPGRTFNRHSLLQQGFAESLATFALVFAGTGAIVTNDLSGGAVTHVGVALTFGLVVTSMIYAVGDISGAHLNPAVTIGFWAAGRLGGRSAGMYIAFQCLGAVVASALVRLLFQDHGSWGTTVPSGPVWQSFVLEIVLTAMLMFVILCVSSGAKEKGIMAGVAVGSVIALEALFAGPISGASMNPARSLGPAAVSLEWLHLWIYIAAPISGSLMGVAAFLGLQADGSRRPPIVETRDEESTKMLAESASGSDGLPHPEVGQTSRP